MKLETITEQEVEEIAEAFADYQYENGEEGLFYLFPDSEAVMVYMRAFIHAGVKCGWLYTTGEEREGYIMISDSASSPSVSALLIVIKGCLKALGLKGCIRFVKAIKSGGESLESRMKKEKKDFIKIEMVAVRKSCQGQGCMRKVVDIAFRMGEERGLPCILDTDGRLKRDKYLHLGMQSAGVRQIGEHVYLYDLVKPAAESRQKG